MHGLLLGLAAVDFRWPAKLKRGRTVLALRARGLYGNGLDFSSSGERSYKKWWRRVPLAFEGSL